MIKKITKENGSLVLELSRFDRIWFCSECNKEFKTAPSQCSCGATDKVFLEKTLSVEESKRKEYKVLSNIIFDADQVDKDSIVSLIEKDRITKNLLSRKLIQELSRKEEVKV